MAELAVLGQQIVQVGDIHLVLSRVRYNSSGDTVTVPTGVASAAVLYGTGDGTAPTASTSAGRTSDTVTLTGGDTGVTCWLITRHGGSLAGLGGGVTRS